MVSRIAIVSLICAITLTAAAHAGRRADDREPVTLNKRQLTCLAVAIKEMQRRGWPFRDYQVVITDEGASYSIAFMDDPVRSVGGNGMEWTVRKKDLKLSGPTFYR